MKHEDVPINKSILKTIGIAFILCTLLLSVPLLHSLFQPAEKIIHIEKSKILPILEYDGQMEKIIKLWAEQRVEWAFLLNKYST